MNFKKLSKEELKEISYNDLAFYIMNERKTKLKITDLFDKICRLLNFTKKQYKLKIADFYTTISTDKRFIVLDGGAVDLKGRYSVKTSSTIEFELTDIDLEDERDTKSPHLNEEKLVEEYNSTIDENDYDEKEDLKNLVIIDEKDLE